MPEKANNRFIIVDALLAIKIEGMILVNVDFKYENA